MNYFKKHLKALLIFYLIFIVVFNLVLIVFNKFSLDNFIGVLFIGLAVVFGTLLRDWIRYDKEIDKENDDAFKSFTDHLKK